jgi:hypothetical protein
MISILRARGWFEEAMDELRARDLEAGIQGVAITDDTAESVNASADESAESDDRGANESADESAEDEAKEVEPFLFNPLPRRKKTPGK